MTAPHPAILASPVAAFALCLLDGSLLRVSEEVESLEQRQEAWLS